MAKKSAKSKGFRKQTGKKPYLSKRDIVLMCVLLAALTVASILLFRYDDGALKVQDGTVVTEGDNWLIVNGSGTRGGARYFKLGEASDLDGHDREARPTSTDPNIPEYVYTAQAEDAPIQAVHIAGSHRGAKALADNTAAMLAQVETAEVGAVQALEVGDRTVHYFIYASSPSENDGETAEAADAESEAPYHRELCGYFDASHDSCVVIRVESGADTPEACADDDAMIARLEQAVGAVTLEEGK